MVEKFLKAEARYLRWAVALLRAGETVGAAVVVRDGMVRNGMGNGFSLRDALTMIRAEKARQDAAAAQ